MRDIRIYQPGVYGPGDTIELSEEAGQHVGVVLRMQAGDPLTLFSGDNREFTALITSAHKKKVGISITAVRQVSRESPLAIHLAQAVSKGDRMETVMQKAVELGVASITPIITERCAVKLNAERLEKKCLQWQAIVIAACEQSGRNRVPRVHPPLAFNKYLQTEKPDQNFVLYPAAEKNWRDYTLSLPEVGLIIGPEGGLSAHEIEQLFAHQFAPLSLGPRVLRTETAAIAALSVLQALGGDL